MLTHEAPPPPIVGSFFNDSLFSDGVSGCNYAPCIQHVGLAIFFRANCYLNRSKKSIAVNSYRDDAFASECHIPKCANGANGHALHFIDATRHSNVTRGTSAAAVNVFPRAGHPCVWMSDSESPVIVNFDCPSIIGKESLFPCA